MSGARAAWARRALSCALALLALAAPAAARAEASCPAGTSAALIPPGGWPAPLDRTLSFHARDLSLRDALDRLAAAARLRFSYSADLLPLDRRVCVSHDAVAVGQALAELLQGTAVEPVVAGADHVVLAPRRAQADAPEPPAVLGHEVALERIVVTGSASGAPQRALPVALDVIAAPQLERAGTEPLTRILSGMVPGPWGWEQSPNNLVARYGSIRGASSFGASHPKVFIDGIEVANPLLVTQIAPEAVERIEVIRGPQGAALYGTDAISGVIHIVTRHEGSDGAPRARLRTALGAAGSDFARGGTLAQDHALALRTGDSLRSAGVNLAFGATGEFVPGGDSRHFLATANARVVGARSIVTGTARFYAASAGIAANPIVAAVLPADFPRPGSGGPDGQRMRQYTLGVNLRLMPDERWTHALTAGIDGERLRGIPDERTPLPWIAESAVRSAAGGADRVTLRGSSVARLGTVGRADLALTLAAEHSALREETTAEDARFPDGPGAGAGRGLTLVDWTHSTGVVAHASAALYDRLHLTGGVRLERNDGLLGGRYATLPVLGAAWVATFGDATLKLRGAYGKGIRPARTPTRETVWVGSYPQLRLRELAPEEQSGVEGGFDLALGRRLSLQVTRYDQLASGLIQRVALPVDTAGGRPRRTPYVLQNAGEVSNRGWELAGMAEAGAFSLTGALSLVDSRVRRLAPGYTGDLRPGDRMLEVPARTGSATAAWTGERAAASLTAYRAWDWINYDRLALARDFTAPGEHDPEELSGERLRGYWRAYDGVTRLNATAELDLPRGLVLMLSGDNLLGYQRGEPDNLTILPGRTLTLGLRAAF